jgi:aspartyl-tRNA(Asn)/glutamyl-tRNA(Gln) amidotransferase subunit A
VRSTPYVRVLHDEALAAARAAEAEIMAGRYRGPLHGIAIGLKDIYDTAGVPTEGGSKSCLGRIPANDATTTRLLKEAGVVLLGKLTIWEFAIGRHRLRHAVPTGAQSLEYRP